MVKKGNIFVKVGAKHSILLFVYVLSALVVNVSVIIGNDYLARATDKLMDGDSIDFSGLFIPLAALIVIGTLMTYIKSISGSNYSANVQRDVKGSVVRRLVNLPYKYYDEKGTGSIMTKLVSDINEVGRFFSEVMPELIVDVIMVVTVTVYLLNMDVWLVVVLYATYPFLLMAADMLSKRLTSVVKKRRNSMDLRTQVAFDAVQGIEVVKSYNLESAMQKKINYHIDDVAAQGCKSTKITSMGYVIRHTVNTVPVVICYMFALYETLSGKMTTGDMLAFSVLLSRVVWPLGNIVFCVNDIRELNVSLKRVQEIYSEDVEESGTYIYSKDEGCDYAIQWNDVKFSYDDERNVVNNMSFGIKQGETVAFAGGSGEGKSTVFKLLCGFYKKTGGEYKLFGHRIEDWQLESARNCYSYVSQNVFLFPQTIWENVAFGKPGATKDEVVEACKSANIHDFIIRLPDGYDTMVGERGVRLSGGERQRLSIARAFLKDAPILLLDEPTASVDAGTEQLLQEAIDRVSIGKTVLIIAHRLSTIQNADRIYVVDKGTVAESGTHEELIALEGIYATMHGKEAMSDES